MPGLPTLRLHHEGWIDPAVRRHLRSLTSGDFFLPNGSEVWAESREAIWEEADTVAFQAIGIGNPWHFLYDDLLSLQALLALLARSHGLGWGRGRGSSVLLFDVGSRRLSDVTDAVTAWGRVLRPASMDWRPLCFLRLAAGLPMGLVRQGTHKVSPGEAAVLRTRLLGHWRLSTTLHGAANARNAAPKAVLADRRENRRLLGAANTAHELAVHTRAAVDVVYLEDLRLRAQAALLASSTALLGVCGAALANSMFLPTGACVGELFLRFRGLYANLAAVLDLSYFAWPPEEQHGEEEKELGLWRVGGDGDVGVGKGGRACSASVIGESALQAEGDVCREFLPNKRRDFRVERPDKLADALLANCPLLSLVPTRASPSLSSVNPQATL